MPWPTLNSGVPNILEKGVAERLTRQISEAETAHSPSVGIRTFVLPIRLQRKDVIHVSTYGTEVSTKENKDLT